MYTGTTKLSHRQTHSTHPTLCAPTGVIWRDFLYLYMVHPWDWLFICVCVPPFCKSAPQRKWRTWHAVSQTASDPEPKVHRAEALTAAEEAKRCIQRYIHSPSLHHVSANTPTLSALSGGFIATAGWCCYLMTFKHCRSLTEHPPSLP